jgi:catechol 2,3-dioxygenase-like lactoylglutathione lyase family enzyme
MELKTGGVHHLALVAKDLKATHDFYTKVMGMKLTCAIHVPPYPESDAMHLFYDMGGGNQLAFFWFKDAPDPVVGQAQPKSPAHVNANGSMHHLAFGVDTEEDLLAFREHLKENGLKVTPMIDQFCGRSSGIPRMQLGSATGCARSTPRTSAKTSSPGWHRDRRGGRRLAGEQSASIEGPAIAGLPFLGRSTWTATIRNQCANTDARRGEWSAREDLRGRISSIHRRFLSSRCARECACSTWAAGRAGLPSTPSNGASDSCANAVQLSLAKERVAAAVRK